MNLEETKRKTRKYKDILASAGYGIIILNIWACIKEIFYIRWIFPNVDNPESSTYNIALLSITGVLLILSLATGFLAKHCGKRDIKEKAPIFFLSIILGILAFVAVAIDLLLLIQLTEYYIFAILSFILDVLFSFFVLEIVVSIFLLKKNYGIIEEANNER